MRSRSRCILRLELLAACRVRAVIAALRMETSLRTPCTSAGLRVLPIRWRRRLRNRRHLIAAALCIAVLLTYIQMFLAVGRHPRSVAVDVPNTANLVDYVGAHLDVHWHTTLPRSFANDSTMRIQY